MATELLCPDSMPCHNQKVNSVSSLEPPRPGDVIPDHAGGDRAPAEGESQACSNASLNSDSSGGRSNCDAQPGDSLLGDCELSGQIGAQLKLLPMNDQIRELQTIIRDKTASRGDFMFSADRLIRLVVEEGLNQLPYKECMVTTPTGEAMEQGLRDCCRSIRIGKILIQSDEETQRAKVYYAKFPPDIYRRKVLLMYPILSTGNTVIEAVKVLIEHGVQPSVIIVLSLFSTPHGAKSIIQEFPEITILTTELHPVAPTHFGQKYFGTD
ncbi:PREDICTED: uracil phosphoribosyltransferase homolog isoform X2 [Hipposideros armiger]|uniref:Uracil phosphoribosyltransferase homolog isoform X2 n=1 Tax=Hipposideros armiger TaxID=186990 RepID=A0A8B7QE46_HIPAR|nr:PREDICTED: uracil phosphoribosyltransferase homolog isoform X2 [Hipposideros armiger]